MAYIPDPTNANFPTDAQFAETAAPEFRALKAYVAGVLAGGLNGINTLRKNFIINGSMEIDQYNEGGAVTVTTGSGSLVVDRWKLYATTAATFTSQRIGNFPVDTLDKYIHILAPVADAALDAAAKYVLAQIFRGTDFAPAGWGTAAARNVSISFQFKTRKPGQYGGAIQSYDGAWSYPFKFTYTTVDTWQYVTVVVPALSQGTWPAGNQAAAALYFNLGCGTGLLSAPGAWVNGAVYGSLGDLQLSTDTASYIDLTMVQVEAGSASSIFEYRPYNSELELCLAFMQKTYTRGIAANTQSASGAITQLNYSTAQGSIVDYRLHPPLALTGTLAVITTNPVSPGTGFRDVTNNVTVPSLLLEATDTHVVLVASGSPLVGLLEIQLTVIAEYP